MRAPEQLTIDTPEQIALEYALASAGSRFLALAIDSLIQAAGFVVIALLAFAGVRLGMTLTRDAGPWVVAIALLAAFVLYYGYFALFESWWGGQTPGKRAVGIRVIAVSGRPLSPIDAVLRNLLRIIDQLPAIYAVGLLSVFLTPRNQRIGDLAAGTVVIHDRPVERPPMPRKVEGATRYGARLLSPEEIAVVDMFLARRTALEPDVRLSTARRIAARVGPRLGVELGTEIDFERIFEEIVSEYRSG